MLNIIHKIIQKPIYLSLIKPIFSQYSDPKDKQNVGTFESIAVKKRDDQREGLKQYQKSLPIERSQKFINDNLVEVTLYMKHDQWQSQYIFAIMNYQKIGFQRVSDLALLDSASYHLNLRKMKDYERWPLARIQIALDPEIILIGPQSIYEFFLQNYYFRNSIDRQSAMLSSVQKFIEQSIIPSLQSVFWHPLLTIQYSFHSNIYAYTKSMKNYMIYGILYRNIKLLAKRLTKNMILILKNRQKYIQSKQTLTNNLKEIQKLLPQGCDFFGGDKPNHMDFYFFAVLKTRAGSKHFIKYLEEQIGGFIWKWWIRMGNLTQYDRERMTFL